VRSAAARAVGGLGAVAARPEILARLAGLLRDPDAGVRHATERTVGGLGAAAATPEFLARLAGLLRDPDAGVQSAAAEAVGGLGAAAATAEILAGLARLLRDRNPWVRSVVARVMETMIRKGVRIFMRRGFLGRQKILAHSLAELAGAEPVTAAAPGSRAARP
jgi:HEAT repeat protein